MSRSITSMRGFGVNRIFFTTVDDFMLDRGLYEDEVSFSGLI